MIFGSWSHTSSLIYYQFWEKTPELPQYTPNNEWKLLAVTQSKLRQRTRCEGGRKKECRRRRECRKGGRREKGRVG